MLRGHCTDLGRDINEITISTNIQNIHLLRDGEDPEQMPAWAMGRLTPEVYRQNVTALTIDQLAARVEANIAAGASYINIYFTGLASDQEPLRRFAREVMPRFA